MMFSSNQVLEVSGNIEHKGELQNALELALTASGHNQPTSKIVYQITPDGRYCIGWAVLDIPDGWKEYPFEFDISITSQIIAKHLNKQSVTYGGWDGSYHKGFLMKAIKKSLASEESGIKNPFYGIVEFSPFTCFYSK